MIGAVAVVSLTACTSGSDDGASSEPADSPAPVVVDPSPTTEAHTTGSDVPEPTLSPEPTSAGPLQPDDMPSPDLIGAGWTFTVVDGDPHDTGFVSNDAATHQRDPREVASLAVPFGCTERTASDTPPEYALDATYTDGQRQAVAIRMRFASAEEAARFSLARHSDLEQCAQQPPAYDGRQTVPHVATVESAVLSERTEPAVAGHWTEVQVVIDDTDVLLLAVQDLPRPESRRLASAVAR